MTHKALKASGRSGSALPGLVVEKAVPSYLRKSLATLPQGVIVVSGTNGKTTTTSLLVALLEAQGLRVLTNETGSNFVRGVVSATVAKSSWTGKLPYDIAVFEQDEAHAVHFVRHVKPRGVLLLNVTRDQMDRFGEIDTTAQMLARVGQEATEFIVLNANDERVGAIEPSEGVKRSWFAHSERMRDQFRSDDQLYAHDVATHVLLGQPETWLETYGGGKMTIRHGREEHVYKLGLPGVHNAQNFVAALATLYEVAPKASAESIAKVAKSASPVFGRGEVVTLAGGRELTLQLIKNPSGFRQALKMVEDISFDQVGIAINDDYADGRDVSWLWDVQYDVLKEFKVHCGGDRATDMAVRLKYDEVPRGTVESDMKTYLASLDSTLKADQKGILFCTYTAMRAIRIELLGAASGLEEITEEQAS